MWLLCFFWISLTCVFSVCGVCQCVCNSWWKRGFPGGCESANSRWTWIGLLMCFASTGMCWALGGSVLQVFEERATSCVSRYNNWVTVTVLEPGLSSPPPAEIPYGISTTGRVLSELASTRRNSKTHPLHRGDEKNKRLTKHVWVWTVCLEKSHITQT